MAEYYFLINGVFLEEELRPALGECVQKRSFAPCRALCERLLPQGRQFAERYYLGEQPLLIEEVLRAGPFDRDIWKSLIGECLFVAATEIPEVQTVFDSLCRLVTPPLDPRAFLPRDQFSPLHMAHFGARDLTFGGVVYRPDRSGYNSVADVQLVAEYLDSLDPEKWQAERFTHLRDPEDRLDELEFTRQIFELLRAMYRTGRTQGQAIVCEQVEV